jgi:hypothetical protein
MELGLLRYWIYPLFFLSPIWKGGWGKGKGEFTSEVEGTITTLVFPLNLARIISPSIYSR